MRAGKDLGEFPSIHLAKAELLFTVYFLLVLFEKKGVVPQGAFRGFFTACLVKTFETDEHSKGNDWETNQAPYVWKYEIGPTMNDPFRDQIPLPPHIHAGFEASNFKFFFCAWSNCPMSSVSSCCSLALSAPRSRLQKEMQT